MLESSTRPVTPLMQSNSSRFPSRPRCGWLCSDLAQLFFTNARGGPNRFHLQHNENWTANLVGAAHGNCSFDFRNNVHAFELLPRDDSNWLRGIRSRNNPCIRYAESV